MRGGIGPQQPGKPVLPACAAWHAADRAGEGFPSPRNQILPLAERGWTVLCTAGHDFASVRLAPVHGPPVMTPLSRGRDPGPPSLLRSSMPVDDKNGVGVA